MSDAVIVSTARTPIGKAARGSLNNTHGATMGAHVAAAVVKRAGIDASLIEDNILGCGFPEGATGANIARQVVIRAGLPVSIAGTTVNRFCASGLQAISMAANAIEQNGSAAVLSGGLESISMVQPTPRDSREHWIDQHKPDLYLPMIDTADIVAERYGVSRDTQDEYALTSQLRMAAAQDAKLFANEIVPMAVEMAVKDRDTGEISFRDLTFSDDECNRPSTTLKGLNDLQPVRGEGQFVTAGNASQLSDGASAMLLMSAKEAAKAGAQPLGAFRGFAVAGCEPDEMGVGPIYAIPRLLQRAGLKVADIDLWEINEAFASQALYCRDYLEIDPDICNVNGGSIAMGHPFGMTGARLAGHLLLEGSRRKAKFGVVSMCIGGGHGAAGLFEIY